jgi:circadian clock protein KaiB
MRIPGDGMVTKKSKTPGGETAAYEEALGEANAPLYVLMLCVSGMTSRSCKALINLKRICDMHLEGHYQLDIIDLYQQPELAATHQIIATPTLLKSYPPPLRRLIGDLSDTDVTIQRLGIPIHQKGDA